ncbi:MAG: hypothetical protein UDW71_10060, partial [Oscillospiraceae bacterium]|nr:hypothetical protein [Oscillospiraceae bacterium]
NEDNAHFIKNPHIFTYLHRPMPGQVIALDVHVGVQQTADVLQLLDGGGQHRQRNTGEILQIL